MSVAIRQVRNKSNLLGGYQKCHKKTQREALEKRHSYTLTI